jgi:hypothetical protein
MQECVLTIKSSMKAKIHELVVTKKLWNAEDEELWALVTGRAQGSWGVLKANVSHTISPRAITLFANKNWGSYFIFKCYLFIYFALVYIDYTRNFHCDNFIGVYSVLWLCSFPFIIYLYSSFTSFISISRGFELACALVNEYL